MQAFGGVFLKFILASGSLRRQELLSRLLSDYAIVVSDFDEDSIPYEGDPEEYVMTLALQKARTVQAQFPDNPVVLGSDTVVCQDGEILGKPRNREDAYRMLQNLSGKSHQVYSGIALLLDSQKGEELTCTKTSVKFSELSHEEIEAYLDAQEWQDKAGAYGIQGYAARFVEEIHGDYYNVMGLPLSTLYQLLKKHQIIL